MTRDLFSNDEQTAARLEQHNAMPEEKPSPSEYEDWERCPECQRWAPLEHLHPDD